MKVGRLVPFKAFYGVSVEDVKKGGLIYAGCGGKPQKVRGKYL